MRVGWQNWRSAPIGMGMVNCDYRVYTPLGWSNRMNGMDIIARQRVVRRGRVAGSPERKNASLSGMQTGGLYVMTILLEIHQTNK
jgi:hypothetical protein